MKKKLLLLFAIIFIGYSVSQGSNYFPFLTEQLNKLVSLENQSKKLMRPLSEINETLNKEIATGNKDAIEKVLTTLKCANQQGVEHNNFLTLIDYSLPSSEKRLWVFDLANNKLLFHTYVSHGIKTGELLSSYFSNSISSKATSIGVYNTENTYNGRYGLSLKLAGLDRSFNDNAYARFIVMHGAWYVNEDFIKKYGRPGRSWGCPAIPLDLIQPIINTIKDNSLFVAYYPNNHWFSKSKFLNCNHAALLNTDEKNTQNQPPADTREEIYFADFNHDNKREEREPILVMSADSYQQSFNKKVPVERMLRRQINNSEYIALSKNEINELDSNHDGLINQLDTTGLKDVNFVTASVKMIRGYFATEINFVHLGKIKEAKLITNNPLPENIQIYFENRPNITLKSTNKFIRWVGL